MSLIDEALKRARLDAARQDAARHAATGSPRGGGFASPWTHMPQTRRRGLDSRRVVVGAAMALCLAVGGLGAAFLVRDFHGARQATPAGRTPSPMTSSRPDPTRAAASGQAAAAASAPASAQELHQARRASEGQAVAGLPEMPESPRTPKSGDHRLQHVAALWPREPAAGGAEQADSTPRPAAQAHASPASGGSTGGAGSAPSSASAASGGGASTGASGASGASAASEVAGEGARTAADGGTYVGEVKLGDGSSVKLSGIAYSEISPVAVINGKVLGPGQGVDAVTVDKIEPGRVTLRHRSGILFYLRLN